MNEETYCEVCLENFTNDKIELNKKFTPIVKYCN